MTKFSASCEWPASAGWSLFGWSLRHSDRPYPAASGCTLGCHWVWLHLRNPSSPLWLWSPTYLTPPEALFLNIVFTWLPWFSLCHEGASSWLRDSLGAARGLSSCGVRAAGRWASGVVACGLQTAWPSSLHCMWDPSSLTRTKPTSPVLQGAFLTAGSQRKSLFFPYCILTADRSAWGMTDSLSKSVLNVWMKASPATGVLGLPIFAWRVWGHHALSQCASFWGLMLRASTSHPCAFSVPGSACADLPSIQFPTFSIADFSKFLDKSG